MKSPAPSVLLIGVGRFGREHLAEWCKLVQEGRARLAGLVVASETSRAALARDRRWPVHAGFTPALLKNVDAVDIVTPTPTHAELVAACLPYAHVFVEKPLCDDPRRGRALYHLAERHRRTLMVGHVYRHQPLTARLRQAVRSQTDAAQSLRVVFTNPSDEYVPGQDPFLEWIHAFDLLRTVSADAVSACSAWRNRSVTEISIATRAGMRAVLRCGWEGREPVRRVSVSYPDCRIGCDYRYGTFEQTRRECTEKCFLDQRPVALRDELVTFLGSLAGTERTAMHREQVLDVMSLMNRARLSARQRPRIAQRRRRRHDGPRVAIIGGGVFGATCAIELSRVCEVTLFERHSRLLTEASYHNQWRHHSGFHYPRSIETIQEVQAAKRDFEAVYSDAIVSGVDAYFAVSAFGKEITRERYIATCAANGLTFCEVKPPRDVVYPDRVSVCLKTDETVVEMDRLARLLAAKLHASRRVRVRLGSDVCGARLLSDGRKRLNVRSKQGRTTEEYDFLINASYANTNIIGHWLGFPIRPLRFDLVELAVYRIRGARKFMMTVLDAPFTSLTSLGSGDLFILSHIHESVLARRITGDGLPPHWGNYQSNHVNLLRHGLRYMPVLKRAQYVESRIGVKVLEANSEDFDGRPTVVTAHGFGCWSVLGGKIVTAVSNARELAGTIAHECGYAEGVP